MSETEVFDARALAAKRAEQAAAAAAAEAARVAALPVAVQQAVSASQRPQTDPLERMLTALQTAVLTRPTLPPLAVAQRHDERLGEMLAEAQRLHQVQTDAANGWAIHRPGTRLFERECSEAADEIEIVELLVNAQACRWAAAYMAQRRALEADQAVRDYGRSSKTLHRHLEDQAAEMRAEMTALLERCIAERKGRYRDEATEVLGRWQPLRALEHWCEQPQLGWKPLHPSEVPEEVFPVWLRTMHALGEELPEPTKEGSYIIRKTGEVIDTSDRRW